MWHWADKYLAEWVCSIIRYKILVKISEKSFIVYKNINVYVILKITYIINL